VKKKCDCKIAEGDKYLIAPYKPTGAVQGERVAFSSLVLRIKNF
jgi:hypothetical protein